MKEFLLGFQVVCLVIQLGCLVYGIAKEKDLFKLWYGFAIWGCVPNMLAMMIGKCL